MRKLFIIANAIMLALIIIFDIGYMLNGGLVVKSIASSFFVLTGIINLMYCIKHKNNLKYPVWMIVALIFAMLGDILLLINFYIGAAAFAVGHIFYFVSYCTLQKINRKDLICGTAISVIALSVILFMPFLDFKGMVMQGVCCAYAIIISFMVGKAISNRWNENNPLNTIIVVGSILFFFSDLMLVLKMFGNIPVASYLCLGTYYPAQFLLAFSLFSYSSVNALKQSKDMV